MPCKGSTLDVDYLVQEYRSGRSSPDLANELGVTITSITKHLKRAGVEIRGNRRPLDVDAIVNRYSNGESSQDIAASFKVSAKVVLRVLRECGVTLRPSAATPSVSIPLEEAVGLFNGGMGISGIAERFGVAPQVVLRVFRDAGVRTRNRSEQQTARMARATPEERRALVTAANEIVRGRPASWEAKLKAAAACQQKGSRSSILEARLAELLHVRGIPTVPQVAIGPYNCDLAAAPIAVEVFGGHWHWTGAHLARTEERFRYILDSGWHILAIAVQKSFPLTPAVADYLAAEIETLRGDPTAPRQYRVIWGAGEFTTGGRLDDDHISIEPPFRGARDAVTGQYTRIPR